MDFNDDHAAAVARANAAMDALGAAKKASYQAASEATGRFGDGMTVQALDAITAKMVAAAASLA